MIANQRITTHQFLDLGDDFAAVGDDKITDGVREVEEQSCRVEIGRSFEGGERVVEFAC